MKTVLAHEWLITPAGSDKVAAQIANAFDVDQIVTGIEDPAVRSQLVGSRPVRALWTNNLPNAAQWRMRYAPALLGAWATTRVRADLLLTSTHFAAMGAGHRFDGPHIAYCHSPMRFAWRQDLESDRLRGRAAFVAKGFVPALQRIDRSAADTVTMFVANSTSIAERIQTAYGRRAAVVHPCVDVDRFRGLAAARKQSSPAHSTGHFLCFGRLVAYKRIDLAVRVCTTLSLPLVVAGDGPELARLQSLAGPTVTFEQHVTDERYMELLAGATALLFPGEEDFGIVPVEAMAAGIPVVAYGVGGVLDTVVDGVTGVLFADQTSESLVAAIELLDATQFEVAKLAEHADQFGLKHFNERLREVVDGHLRAGRRDVWESRSTLKVD